MIKQDILCISVIQHSNLIPAFIQGEHILKKRDPRKNKQPKILFTLTKDFTFSITKTQILQNKKYKFYLQLKAKIKQFLTIVVDGKDVLDNLIRHLSRFGMATGLQQMMVSCQKIGQGSFAQVYKVITNYDTVMALKAFDRKNLKIAKNKLAFHNEIDVMRILQSKYIATVDGVFQTQKNLYLKMEYFSLSLKEYIKKNISIKSQKRIMKQLLQALVQMKMKNIIHRDLKPENVMIRGKHQKTMECVIIDFGLATPANLEKYLFNRCGTPGFLAPQIAKMTSKLDKLTPACDIFSLGCIFYKILTKKYIFASMNYNQVVDKNKTVDIPWDSFQKLSQNQRNLITKMLQKDPNKRITPQQAIKHAYFDQQIDDQDEISIQDCDLLKKMKCFQQNGKPLSRRLSMQSLMSSFHTNSKGQMSESITAGTHKKRYPIKDSCLSFEGPIKGSQQGMRQSIYGNMKGSGTGANNNDLRQMSLKSHKTNYGNRRVSRFSRIDQIPVL